MRKSELLQVIFLMLENENRKPSTKREGEGGGEGGRGFSRGYKASFSHFPRAGGNKHQNEARESLGNSEPHDVSK